VEAWLIGVVVAVALAVISAVWRKSRSRILYAVRLPWTPWGREIARQALAIERLAAGHSSSASLQSKNWNSSAKLEAAFHDYYSGRGDCPTMEQATAWYEEEFPSSWQKR
jgi:hypothetical protein